MATVNLTIDGRAIVADESKTVLEAALDNGIYIPHLCHHNDLHPNGGCRLCVVKQEGEDGVITSCSTKVKEGMVINTKDETAEKVRKLSVELMFRTHPDECVGCHHAETDCPGDAFAAEEFWNNGRSCIA